MINSTTHKTAYQVGETPDVPDLTKATNMSDGATQTIPVTAEVVSGFEGSRVLADQS